MERRRLPPSGTPKAETDRMSTKTLEMRGSGFSQKQLRQILGGPIAVGLAIVMTGCAGPGPSRRAPETVDDAATSKRVRRAISHDNDYRYAEIEVVTFKGNVHLTGYVDSTEQKKKATDIAKAVAGVKDVENRLALR